MTPQLVTQMSRAILEITWVTGDRHAFRVAKDASAMVPTRVIARFVQPGNTPTTTDNLNAQIAVLDITQPTEVEDNAASVQVGHIPNQGLLNARLAHLASMAIVGE